ncbi:MAG: SurA N-terminal domain-containing protein, partial [Nitrospirota bacterium]
MPAFTLQKAVAAVAAVGLSCGLPAGAADIRDRIVAVVNTEIIALSELEEEVAEVTLQAQKRFRGAELDQRLRQIDYMGLNRMIERKLQLQIAKRRGIKISDEEVQDAIVRLRRVGEAPNEKDPREVGLIRDQLTAMRLVNQQVRSGLLVSDEEVLRFYQQHKDRFMLPP